MSLRKKFIENENRASRIQSRNVAQSGEIFPKKDAPRQYEAVVIGVSSGGLNALSRLLPLLAPDVALAIIIVQHQHPHADNFLAAYLDKRCRIPVREAAEKEPILPNTAYIAPPNYHLLVEADRTFSFASTEKVNYARPSVDMLFITAAETYQSHLIGVILTGANSDGSHGLKIIKEYGGLTIVQNPATAEAASMPEAALKATSVDYILSLEDIGHLLNQITREKSAN